MKKYKKIILFIFFVCITMVITGVSNKKQEENNIILMVMADKDFYDPEYTMPREKLEESGFRIEVANVSGATSVGIDNLNVKADLAIKNADEKKYTALLLVGGYGAASLYDNKELIKLVRSFANAKKIIGAQCFTPIVLAQAGLLKGQKATCWQSQSAKLESYGVIYTGAIIEKTGNILTAPSGSQENITAFIDEYVNMLGVKNNTIADRENSSYLRDYVFPDFNEIHSPVDGSKNEYLILGNIPVIKPDKNIPKEFADLIGRWEGYVLSPPVSKDIKVVLFIQEITKKYIKGFSWHTTNLQYPYKMSEFKADIIKNDPYQFVIKSHFLTIASSNNLLFTYDRNNNQLIGELIKPDGKSILDPKNTILSRGDKFRIYKDYDKFLASKHIYVKEYKEKKLQEFGKGYMVYLPQGYEKNKEKKWPLIIFLHGSGDRGDNIHLIAKASPFMIVREKQDIPFIIAAPIFNNASEYRSFPTKYIDDFLSKIIIEYRIDTTRVYFTGLSMGGEATYRYAIYHPDKVAAIAPLCAPLLLNENDTQNKIGGWPNIDKPISYLKDMPIWTIGGGKDILVPKDIIKKTANTVKKAGGNVKITILEENDHDVWTDTYSDPSFYDWFLKYKKAGKKLK